MNIRDIARKIWITTQALKKEIVLLDIWLTWNEKHIYDNISNRIISIVWKKYWENN